MMVNEYVQEINKKDITQDHYLGLLSWGCYQYISSLRQAIQIVGVL